MKNQFLKPIEDLEFTDDFMFTTAMKNEEICKGVLQTILGIKIKKIEYLESQRTFDLGYNSKGIRLDVYAEDSDKVFDVEVQNKILQEIPRRTRYYQSMIDMDQLLKGQPYTNLKDSYVIFISKSDFFAQGLPFYTFENLCNESPKLKLSDGTTKIYVNASAFSTEKNLAKKSLLCYINTKKATDNFTQNLDQTVEKIKAIEEFRGDYMSWALAEFDAKEAGKKEGFAQGIAIGEQRGIAIGEQRGRTEGIAIGRTEAKLDTAKNAIKMGININQIVTLTGLSIEEIKELQQEM